MRLRRVTMIVAVVAAAFASPAVSAANDEAGLRSYVAAQRALPKATRLPRTLFFEDRVLTSVRLSPTGAHVAWLRKQGESRSVWLQSTTGGAARVLLERTDAEELHWSRDGLWLFLKSNGWLRSISVQGRVGIRLSLGGLERRSVMQADPSRAASVLIRERVLGSGGKRWRIVRMSATGQRCVLREDSFWIHELAFDALGNVRALTRFERQRNTLMLIGTDGRLREVARLRPLGKLMLLGTLPSGDLLLQGHGGSDRQRLLRLGADGRLMALHEDPRGEADLDEVVLDGATGAPMAASYRSTVAATYGLGDARSAVEAIVRRFPGRDLALQTAAGRWLVAERDATLRDAHWQVFDVASGTARRIHDAADTQAVASPERALTQKVPVAFAASDGRRIHGFLLIPPGVDPARAPLVAQVHGGPMNHFRTGLDGVAQFLANRGYVVYQSNFRGSTGHGVAYTHAANGGFADGRVQADITEGVRWLLAQGIGDPRRVGIIGHSFGGYSTLLGVTSQPDLFKVGFAGAPPSDLGWSFRWELANGYQAALPDRSLREMLREVSLDASEPAVFSRLHAISPLAHASKMRRPLLIFAGGKDPTVPIRSVNHYVARLRMTGADVTLLVDPDGGHSPKQPIAQEAYLHAMEAILHRHLGGDPGEPAGARLQAWLEANARTGRVGK